MSQTTQGFFSSTNSNNSGNNMGGFQQNYQIQSISSGPSGFNQSQSTTNHTSVITVNWEREVENVFMDEIGKLSTQFGSNN